MLEVESCDPVSGCRGCGVVANESPAFDKHRRFEEIIKIGRRIACWFRNFEPYRLRMLLIIGGLDASPHAQL